MERKTSLSSPFDVLTLGKWIHRVDADRSRGHRVPADLQEQHHRHTCTGAERSWRWLTDVLEASGHCEELVTYGHSVDPDTNRAAVFCCSCQNIQGGPKKVSHKIFPISFQILTDFQKFFTAAFCEKFVVKWLLNIPPHLNCVATLPCET